MKEKLPQGQEKWQPFKDGTEVIKVQQSVPGNMEGHLMCSGVL